MTPQELFDRHPGRFSDVEDIEVPFGWMKWVDDLCVSLDQECARTGASYLCVQVKGKFGELRFYFDSEAGHTADAMDDIVAQFEKASSRICETCGAPGRKRGTRWISVLCDAHAGTPK